MATGESQNTRKALTLGILKEQEGDNRVAMLPEATVDLKKLNISLIVEKGAGEKAYISDEDYERVGATVADRQSVMQQADIIIQINPPTKAIVETLPEGKTWISLIHPSTEGEVLQAMSKKHITTLSLTTIPRTSRAQTMDVLSSQANIAGYKAVLLAAANLPSFFPMLTTAAGSIPPAKVLVLGAGVAGLQAIATARRLGAVVEAFDVRSAVKEEVQSLGATFVEVEGAVEKDAGGYAVEQDEDFKKRQQEAIDKHAAKSDVVITTAQIPGREAPKLISRETTENMKPGSVIVDLAASTGGNCELTKDNETVVHKNITILGNSNLPSTLPKDASKMFGKNIFSFLKILVKQEQLDIDLSDDIIDASCLTYEGNIRHNQEKTTA